MPKLWRLINSLQEILHHLSGLGVLWLWLTLSHDLLEEAQCVPHPLNPPFSVCWLWGPVKDHGACNRSGPLWALEALLGYVFSEMLWIGQLKRLSRSWPTAIKSSPTGYRNVDEGRLCLCLIQQFIEFFSLCWHLPKSVENLWFTTKYPFFVTTLCIWKMHQKEMYLLIVVECSLLCGRDADVRLGEVRWVRLKLNMGAGKIVLL